MRYVCFTCDVCNGSSCNSEVVSTSVRGILWCTSWAGAVLHGWRKRWVLDQPLHVCPDCIAEMRLMRKKPEAKDKP